MPVTRIKAVERAVVRPRLLQPGAVRQLDLQGNCPCFKPGLGPRPARCSRLLIFFGGTFFSLRFPAEKAHPLPWVYLG